jgi:hypothetical protein
MPSVAAVSLLRRQAGAIAPWPLCPGPALSTSAFHPFVVANRLVTASYVSLQMALSYYSLIPEHVAVITSVTTNRPGQWDTPYGRFAFKHVQTDFFYGFEYRAVSNREHAFVASPEKALLDLVYLQPGGDKPEYLTSLRLQHLDQLDVNRLFELAQSLGKPKL